MTAVPPTAPAPRHSFWQRWPGVLTIVGICVAGVGLLFLLPLLNFGPSADDIDVRVVSCEVDSIGNARVGLSVTNKSDQAVSAKLGVEYRDSAGARLDTDTAYVRNIAPGDTARSEELTALDAAPDGSVTCQVVSKTTL